MSNFTYSQCGSIIYDVLLSVSESVIFGIFILGACKIWEVRTRCWTYCST